MLKIIDWIKEQTLETKTLLVFALVLVILVAVPKKPKADGTVLKVLQLDGICYKIEKGYSTYRIRKRFDGSLDRIQNNTGRCSYKNKK